MCSSNPQGSKTKNIQIRKKGEKHKIKIKQSDLVLYYNIPIIAISPHMPIRMQRLTEGTKKNILPNNVLSMKNSLQIQWKVDKQKETIYCELIPHSQRQYDGCLQDSGSKAHAFPTPPPLYNTDCMPLKIFKVHKYVTWSIFR